MTTQIFVPTLADPRRLHTMKMLDAAKIEYTMVVHDKDARQRLIEQGFKGEIAVTTGGTANIADKRNWIMRHLAKKNEWYVSMDDNIQYFTAVREPWLNNDRNAVQSDPPDGLTWRSIYNEKTTPRRWLSLLGKDVAMAKKGGAPIVGVATMENPFFREARYSWCRFVKAKVFSMLNTKELYWATPIASDSYISAMAVAKFGKVLVDSYLHHRVRMYEVGGLGTREEREARGLLKFMDQCCEAYPGLVGVGRGKNTALRFLINRPASIERWRREHGYI